ncbi:MAG: flagellar basal-body MS-ring/collar protein FliF [Desulfobacterales bacterium]|jgi:flagellar M-ring protein FliF|nr:flagellar M-ring protein FliF [Deltaproteobacteria bacterium]
MPFRQIISQLQTFFNSISLAKRIALLTLAVGSVAAFVFLLNWTGKPEFLPLYSHLDANDAGVIVSRLKEQKIPYRLTANGSTILIPQELIYETRMNLASEGLPQGGSMGFELFDNTKLGMTEFAQNVNYQRALQGELVRSINGFEEVDSCRVHIVMPEKSLFVEEEESASASVVLKLHHGKWLSQPQVQGIVHLVSSSVSRLTPENVTVVDSNGRLLTGHNDPSGITPLSADQLDHQLKVERKLENRVLSMLEKALGANRAIVRVSCALNFKQHEMTEERFFPENQVVRSEQTFQETAKESDPIPTGIPGIQSNLPESSAALNQPTEDENTTFAKQDRTVNYEIGKMTSRTLDPVGGIERISVAVMVDGTYQSNVTEEGETTVTYVARSAEEMTKIENLVKRAVNFDANRGDQVEVVNIPFETAQIDQSETESTVDRWLVYLKKYKPYLKYTFLTLFLFLTFVFVVKPLIKWLTAQTAVNPEIFQQLPKTVGELENEYGADPNQLTLNDEISRLITHDSEASVGAMRDWLKED